MLTFLTYLLTKRWMIMAFCSRNLVTLMNTMQNNSRPFDEILCSFDPTMDSTTAVTNNNDCHQQNTYDDCLT
ncbi:unnamed protein product [Adineta steineri]|uniref:Secreted protein n=1 Tax=Adineta steineri TaxID=433720 RepID=A0A815ZID7_9BILA|nr:unnamed protein product [Adineta steineri]CAF1585043.1 unnamed protein product [Adineta steineri]